MVFEVFSYSFMQRAILAALFAGICCSLMGVFIVSMNVSAMTVAISHSAFTGAILGLLLGVNPLLLALVFSLFTAMLVGPLAERGELNPDTVVGVMFSLMLGLGLLFIGLIEGPRTEALAVLWGSILTVTWTELIVMISLTLTIIIFIVFFFKEIQAVIFDREIAMAAGIPAQIIFYIALFLTGSTIAVSLRPIGGLLVFALMVNPAATAYLLTNRLDRIFLLSMFIGTTCCFSGLFISYVFDLYSGATIVLVSVLVFMTTILLAPKKKVKEVTT